MRPWIRALTATPIAFAGSATAFADVAPDPVETTGITVVALAIVAALIFGGVVAFRYARARGRAPGSKR
jgi:hypothetical protein